MRFFSAAILILISTAGAIADDTGAVEHYVSLRSFVLDNVPRFVLAADTANDERASPIQACNGQTYYLSAEDIDEVQAALYEGDTVQLHETPTGSSPIDAAVLCLFNAGQ